MCDNSWTPYGETPRQPERDAPFGERMVDRHNSLNELERWRGQPPNPTALRGEALGRETRAVCRPPRSYVTLKGQPRGVRGDPPLDSRMRASNG